MSDDGDELDKAAAEMAGEGEFCETSEAFLDRLMSRKPLPRSEIEALAVHARQAVAERDSKPGKGGTDTGPHERQLAVWRAIHLYLHAVPFRDRQRIKRSDQWREVLPRVRDLGESELIDWVALQAEVAANRERGIPDMRPRKNGPTFLVMLEYVANRKRKAMAIVKWMRAADTEGCWIIDSAFHAETKRILAHYGIREYDETGAVIPTDEPLARIS